MRIEHLTNTVGNEFIFFLTEFESTKEKRFATQENETTIMIALVVLLLCSSVLACKRSADLTCVFPSLALFCLLRESSSHVQFASVVDFDPCRIANASTCFQDDFSSSVSNLLRQPNLLAIDAFEFIACNSTTH